VILIFGRKYDVITLGSATIDNFIIINQKYKSIKPGDKIISEGSFIETGGGAANAAISISNMGLKSKIITKIGSDHNSVLIRHNLKEHKVDFDKNVIEGFATPFSVVLVSEKDEDRVVFTYKGPKTNVLYKDVNLKNISTYWLYISSLMGLDDSHKTAERLIDFTKKQNIKIFLNPSVYLIKERKNILHKLLHSTKILILNKEEASFIVGKKLNAHELLINLKSLGPEIVVITDGPNAINAIDSKCTYKLEPYNVNIISTLGAGDAFSSGFLSGYIKNKNIESSLRIGAANSASVLQHYGATIGLLTYKQALEFVKNHRSKLEEHCNQKW
jgi:ribokinase